MHSFATYLSLLLLFPVLPILSHAHAHPPIPCDAQVHVCAPPVQHYHNLVRRRAADTTNVTKILPARNGEIVLEKRAGGARFTRYAAGLGACGGHNKDGDFVVALNQPQWDGGSHCYETITITYNGKSVQAQIVDKCVGCPPNALDLSNGLFAFLDPGDMVYGDWSFGSAKPTQPKAPPESTSHSTMSISSTPSSTATSSSSISAATTTTSAETTTSTGDLQFLNQINIAVVNLCGLIGAGQVVQG